MVKLIVATIGLLLLLWPCENRLHKLQGTELNQEEIISDGTDFESSELERFNQGPFPLEVVQGEDNYFDINPFEVNSANVNPEKMSVLRLLYSSPHSEEYLYKCSAGDTAELACHLSFRGYRISFPGYYVKLRCGDTGSGLIISSMRIYFMTRYPNAHCSIIEGGIGLDYIGVIIKSRANSVVITMAEIFTD